MNRVLSRYVGDRAFYKRALAVAVPIMLQNGITNFVGMLDNIMVGRVGTVEMTGVAVANQLLFVFQLCLFGAVSGAGIFGAQFYGKQDQDGLRYSFRFKLWLCAILTTMAFLIFGLAGRPLCDLFLQGEGAAADAEASLSAAMTYLTVMFFGLIPTAGIQCYASTLRETGETVLPMKAGIISVSVNLVFNYILIFGHFGAPRLGVAGAAIATVISRFAELAIVAGWTHAHSGRYGFMRDVYRSLYIPRKLAWQMFLKGMPLMLNETLWSAGMTMLNQCYSLRGLNVVAATNISTTFWDVFAVIFTSTGVAIGILVGQQLGAGEFDTVRDTSRKLITFSVAVSVGVGLLYAACAPFIPLIYNTTGDVRSMASAIMMISAAVMPICAFCNAAYFTLRSGGKTFITFLFDCCFVWVVTVPLAYVLSRFTGVNIYILYFCCQAVDIVKCVIGYVMLKKGIWIRNIVNE